ncbi:MAG: NfeD family protein [Verrucomicrobiota bacterium]|jgi:membrane-bound ClpP family serine protease
MDIVIYSICFGVGLLFAVISAFLGHLFGGHGVDGGHVDLGTGGHAEAGFQETGMPGLSPFSPTTITSFITAFGGFGLIFTRLPATRSPWISAPLATLGALLTAAGVVLLFGWVFHKTQSSSESHIATLVGMTATIITPIPPGGVGEIAYVQAGTRYSAPARDERGAPVANGQTVKIVRIVGSQFYVVPV